MVCRDAWLFLGWLEFHVSGLVGHRTLAWCASKCEQSEFSVKDHASYLGVTCLIN